MCQSEPERRGETNFNQTLSAVSHSIVKQSTFGINDNEIGIQRVLVGSICIFFFTRTLFYLFLYLYRVYPGYHVRL